MKKFLILFLMLLTTLSGEAMENKVKLDKQTYNLEAGETKNNEYNFYLKGENADNWHSKITINNLPNLTNPTEAAAELAHKIQEENPGASVLVYPMQQ